MKSISGRGQCAIFNRVSQKASLERGHLSRDPRGLQREPCRFLEEEHFQAEGTQALPGVCEGHQGGLGGWRRASDLERICE